MERHLDPSIYEKIEKTESLLQEGVNEEELKPRGGLDYETYDALMRRWAGTEQKSMEFKQEIYSNYRSLENAPPSIGPCQKHDPVTGTKNALVLLTEFNDKKHSHEAIAFNDMLFNKDFKQSMRNYYLEASWNQLDIKGHVNDEWYTLTKNRSEYADDLSNLHYPKAQKLVIETIENAKNSGKIDFSPYSVDGKIEILIVVYAGSGMDTKLDKNFIRPHQYRLLESIEVQEGIFADKYCLVPELPVDDLGVFCHEVGHILGLPDLYMEGYSPIVGSWCLMGIGDHINDGKTPAHPSAWCKLHLGWTEPKLLDQLPQKHEIPSVIDDKTIYKVEIQDSNGKEYFLLENRQQKGFDENLPANGLLIWHVDESACLKKAPNFDPKHFFLTLKQSDGKDDLNRDRRELIKKAKIMDKPPKEVEGDSGDPFPGITVNRNFNDKSKPNSRSYKGNKSFVEVVSISDSDKLMKAQIGTNIKSERLETHYKHEILPI
ncbi:MAG: M6 family metalloprotease domain-containing protein, partial [Methanobacterium sp.]